MSIWDRGSHAISLNVYMSNYVDNKTAPNTGDVAGGGAARELYLRLQ